MLQIFKYDLRIEDDQTAEMPAGARILTVQDQRGTPRLWALVDPSAPKETRTFRIHGTGHPVPDSERLSYLASFQMRGGELVFHAFEVVADKN